MGVKLFIGTPQMPNKVVLKNWYGLCKDAWFPSQLLNDSRERGVALQIQFYLGYHLF